MVRAKCHLPFPWSEENQKTSHRLLLLFNKNNRDRIQIQTYSEVSRFAIYNEVCATQSKLPVTQHLENLTFGDDNSDSDEKHGQQEVDNVDYNRHCKHVVPHLNPIYSRQEILTTLSVI